MADPSYRSEPGTFVGKSNVIDVTLTPHTGINADNDVIAATQEIADVFRVPGGTVTLDSIVLIDEDDQAQDVELIFLNANGSVGAEDATYAPTDAVARTIVATHLILTTDYSDANTSQTATKRDLGLLVEAASDSTSLWVAAVCRSGTPTYTAAGLKLKLGFKLD